MATVTKGKTFVSGETVTPAKLNDVVDLATVTAIVNADVSAGAAIHASKLASGSILDAQINSAAAIALSKLATGALPTAITVASANIVDGSIVTADIAPSTIIGSVAQSGGLATGALFETGNNGIYGTWLKLADGTMFCWVVQVYGTWFFPVPFVAPPQVIFGTAATSGAGPVCMFSNVLADRVSLYVQNTNPVAAAPGVGAAWLAIGRWF